MDFNLVIYSSEQIDLVVQQMKNPSNGLQIGNRETSFFSPVHFKCFVASQALKWTEDRFGWTPEEALFFACLLSTRRLIHKVTDRSAKFQKNDDFWRFQCDENGPLNWKYIWITPVEQSACVAVEQLLKDIFAILHLAAPTESTPSETAAALSRVASTQAFQKFERDTSILQAVNLDLTPDQKIAFWINAYNLFLLHALISKFSPTLPRVENPLANSRDRQDFFRTHKYIIGKHTFSLDDIKNGILRATIVDYFGTEDPRRAFGIEKREPRIHTALSYLTKSSPQPFIVYHDKVDYCLTLSCKRYFSKTVTIEEQLIILPKIITEYSEDFLVTRDNVVQFLWPYLQKDQKTLQRLAKNNNYSIKYHDSQWDLGIQADDFNFVFSKAH